MPPCALQTRTEILFFWVHFSDFWFSTLQEKLSAKDKNSLEASGHPAFTESLRRYGSTFSVGRWLKWKRSTTSIVAFLNIYRRWGATWGCKLCDSNSQRLNKRFAFGEKPDFAPFLLVSRLYWWWGGDIWNFDFNQWHMVCKVVDVLVASWEFSGSFGSGSGKPIRIGTRTFNCNDSDVLVPRSGDSAIQLTSDVKKTIRVGQDVSERKTLLLERCAATGEAPIASFLLLPLESVSWVTRCDAVILACVSALGAGNVVFFARDRCHPSAGEVLEMFNVPTSIVIIVKSTTVIRSFRQTFFLAGSSLNIGALLNHQLGYFFFRTELLPRDTMTVQPGRIMNEGRQQVFRTTCFFGMFAGFGYKVPTRMYLMGFGLEIREAETKQFPESDCGSRKGQVSKEAWQLDWRNRNLQNIQCEPKNWHLMFWIFGDPMLCFCVFVRKPCETGSSKKTRHHFCVTETRPHVERTVSEKWYLASRRELGWKVWELTSLPLKLAFQTGSI